MEKLVEVALELAVEEATVMFDHGNLRLSIVFKSLFLNPACGSEESCQAHGLSRVSHLHVV